MVKDPSRTPETAFTPPPENALSLLFVKNGHSFESQVPDNGERLLVHIGKDQSLFTPAFLKHLESEYSESNFAVLGILIPIVVCLFTKNRKE